MVIFLVILCIFLFLLIVVQALQRHELKRQLDLYKARYTTAVSSEIKLRRFLDDLYKLDR